MSLLSKMLASWYDPIGDWGMLPILEEIVANLDILYENRQVYPVRAKVFRIFKEVPYDKVRVIVCGQDPYNNLYDGVPSACGVAFMTENGYKNKSLTMIATKLSEEYDRKISASPNYFRKWMSQGVMFINTALTVEKDLPGSHKKIWAQWTEDLFRNLSIAKPDLVWLLMGDHAKGYKDVVSPALIVESVHPVSRTKSFLEQGDVFKVVNIGLRHLNKKEIEW
jgi:uracil-DNA glycosylase